MRSAGMPQARHAVNELRELNASNALASPAPGFGTTAILSWLHSDRPCRPKGVLTCITSVGRKCPLIPTPCNVGRFLLAELEAFDSEGRCVVTNHGAPNL